MSWLRSSIYEPLVFSRNPLHFIGQRLPGISGFRSPIFQIRSPAAFLQAVEERVEHAKCVAPNGGFAPDTVQEMKG